MRGQVDALVREFRSIPKEPVKYFWDTKNSFIADCLRGQQTIRVADIYRAEINTEHTVQQLARFVEQVPFDLVSREQAFFDKHREVFLDNQNNVRSDYFDHCEYQMCKKRSQLGPEYSMDGKDSTKAKNDARAVAFLCLLRSIALEYLAALRSSPQMRHAILAAKAAVAIDAANVKYFPEQPRMSVDDILKSLEGHGREAIAVEAVDDLKQCEEAIRSLAPIAQEQAQLCLEALQIG
jgi:hypothetical protein